MSDLSASEYLSLQEDLRNEARESMPWDTTKCTYEMGSLKQQVFACRTHKVGVCYSCSIQCHTKCDIVELFTKRGFTCECGTERDGNVNEEGMRCQLRENTEQDICCLTNKHGHNFDGKFCSCDKEYDADSNVVMLQCILGTECNEDWYHDHCIMGNEEPQYPNSDNEKEEAPSNGFPALESFDAFICWKCVSKYAAIFQRIISHPLSDKVISNILPRNVLKSNIESLDQRKRKIDDVESSPFNTDDFSVFLKHNFTETFRRMGDSCSNTDSLYIFLHDLAPFLIEDEPLYEPPLEEDADDDGEHLLHLTLQKDLHREQAIAGISALNELKSKLTDFLKPFAETGQIVKEEDIKTFFHTKN